MPTIDVIGGFRVRIYLNDHGPPHVHVANAKGDLRLYLDDFAAKYKWGRMSQADERAAIDLVRRNRKYFVSEWNRIGPKPR